jgi:dimethylhistidine N-methyltransferase
MRESPPQVDVHDFSPATAQMQADIVAALRETPKRIPSQYLYDEVGLGLFNEICETPEYYITRAELEILNDRGDEIAQKAGPNALVIAPGSGAGIKPRLLLDQLHNPAGYVPIDISCEHLQESVNELAEDYPTLHMVPVCGDFTASDFELPAVDIMSNCHLVYFPGSTIGNFDPVQRHELLQLLRRLCGDDGGVLIGVDLKKPVDQLLAAYDDPEQVSARFALNILTRLENELGAELECDNFSYAAAYEAEQGRVRMFIRSEVAQSIHIGREEIPLAAGEEIRTEWSYKFSPEEFAARAAAADLRVDTLWTDRAGLFSVQYLLPA